MKNKSNKNIISKLLKGAYLCFAGFAIVTMLLTFQGTSNNKVESEFNPTTDSYTSNQTHIISETPSDTSTTVSMAEAILNPTGTSTIRISTADDLYNFSDQCNGSNKNAFLSRSYILTSNIDFSNRSNSGSTFFKPIGWDTAFTGHK